MKNEIITKEQQEEILLREVNLAWLKDQLKTTSAAKVAEQTGLSTTTVLKLKNGNFEGSMASAMAKVEEARQRYLEAVLSGKRIGFIETEIARRIMTACKMAQRDASLTWVVGRTQIGKTEALEQYKSRPALPGRVVMVRMPTAPTVSKLSRRMLAAAGLPGTWDASAAIDALADWAHPGDLFIIDEAHQTFTTAGRLDCCRVWEHLRELYDCIKNRAGMVIATTEIFTTRMAAGYKSGQQLSPMESKAAELAGILSQFERRGEILNLPDCMDTDDVLRVLAAYGLPAPASKDLDYVVVTAQEQGIGRFTRRLRFAAWAAARDGKSFTVASFIGANKRLDGLV